MAFNNYNMNNQAAASNGPKRSWRIGKDNRVSDAKVSIGLYESQKGGVYCTIGVIRELAKDPQTGMSVYESRPPQELPSIMLTYPNLEALIDRYTDKKSPVKQRQFFPNWLEPSTSDPNCVNETFELGYGNKLIIAGSANEIKMTLSTEKMGETFATFKGPLLSVGVNFADWRNMLKRMYFALCYMETNGVDPEKFAQALGSAAGGMSITPDPTPTANSVEDIPI